MTTQDYLNLSSHLEKTGWNKYRSNSSMLPSEYWCKYYDGTPCFNNADKPGVQVVINMYFHEKHTGCEIELTAQKPDGTWVKLMVYSLPDPFIDNMDNQISQLLKAWECLAKG